MAKIKLATASGASVVECDVSETGRIAYLKSKGFAEVGATKPKAGKVSAKIEEEK